MSEHKNQHQNQELKTFEQRKSDHIQLSLDQRTQNLASTHFDQISLVHNALPDFNFSDVQIDTKILNHKFSSPHYISSMTAGHEKSEQINSALAAAAAEKNWLMCVGSQRRELTDSDAKNEWKKIRSNNPKTQFVSNIGIEEVVQYSADQILDLTKSLNSLALIIHLNPLQEIFQKSSAQFSGSTAALKKIISKSKVPIIIKEVGFGISLDLMKQLFLMDVHAVDISGRGGSHWAMIESLRLKDSDPQKKSVDAFSGWGQSVVECLLAAQKIVSTKNIWASGGIRSGVDSAKCLAMGARAVGIAQPLIKAVGNNTLIETMEQFDNELKIALFCTGISNAGQMTKTAFSKKKVWYESR